MFDVESSFNEFTKLTSVNSLSEGKVVICAYFFKKQTKKPTMLIDIVLIITGGCFRSCMAGWPTYPLFPRDGTLPVHQIHGAIRVLSWHSYKALEVSKRYRWAMLL